jgi:hypothetical protein
MILGLVSCAAADGLLRSYPVDIPQTVSTSVTANFLSSNDANVVMQLQNNRPTVHLDNYASIQSVECSTGSAVKIQFNSQNAAVDAFSKWSLVRDLVLMAGHERNCAGKQETVFYSVKSLNNQGPLIVAYAELVASDSVVETYELSVNEGQSRKGFQFGANMNGLKISGPYGNFFCKTCNTKMTGSISANFKGNKKGHLSSYSLEVSGSILAKLGFSADLIQTDKERILFSRALVRISFGNILAPGLFQLSPEFRLMAKLGFASAAKADLSTSYALDLPVKIKVNSPKSIQAQPEFSSSGVPTITQGEITGIQIPEVITLGGHLVPELALALRVMNSISIVDLSLGLDNEIGVTRTVCKESPKDAKLDVFRRHGAGIKLSAIIFNKDWTLFDTGKIGILQGTCPSKQ